MSMSVEEMIEVLQGFKDGQRVQFYNEALGIWQGIVNPSWDFTRFKYRLKPVTNREKLLNKLKVMDNETLAYAVIADCTECLAHAYCATKPDLSCRDTMIGWLNEKGAN